tara:strand:- start:161 stop:877 length:717 start_codon:yes stop_codon:yes gene_type:complete
MIQWLGSLGSILPVNSEESSTFVADEMIIFSKSLDFLREKKFIDVMDNAISDEEDSYKKAQGAIVWRRHILTWAGEHCKEVEGDFCDFGCYDGIGSKIINDYCNLDANDKEFFIYDTFVSPPNSNAFPKHSDKLYEEVENRFKDSRNVRIIKGSLPESLINKCPKKIAFAHIDLNNVDAEMKVLELIFDKVTLGGIIILDDFGWSAYHEQQNKEKEFFLKRGLKVLELPTGQGIVIKR